MITLTDERWLKTDVTDVLGLLNDYYVEKLLQNGYVNLIEQRTEWFWDFEEVEYGWLVVRRNERKTTLWFTVFLFMLKHKGITTMIVCFQPIGIFHFHY